MLQVKVISASYEKCGWPSLDPVKYPHKYYLRQRIASSFRGGYSMNSNYSGIEGCGDCWMGSSSHSDATVLTNSYDLEVTRQLKAKTPDCMEHAVNTYSGAISYSAVGHNSNTPGSGPDASCEGGEGTSTTSTGVYNAHFDHDTGGTIVDHEEGSVLVYIPSCSGDEPYTSEDGTQITNPGIGINPGSHIPMYGETGEGCESQYDDSGWSSCLGTTTVDQEFDDVKLEELVDELMAGPSFDDITEWNHYIASDSFDEETEAAIHGEPAANDPVDWAVAVYSFSDNRKRLTKSKSKYRFKFKLPEVCSGDGSYLFKWREMFVPDDEESSVTYTDKQVIFSPNPGPADEYFYTDEFSAAVPEEEGVVYIVGSEISAFSQPIAQALGYSAKKKGFLEYANASWPPRVYRRESVTGGFPGCAATGQAPKSYSGNQQYKNAELATSGIQDPGGEYEWNFSSDVPDAAVARSYPEVEHYAPNTMTPTTVTKTTREYARGGSCGGTPIVDRLQFSLSDEYTTGMLHATVNAVLAQDWDTATANPRVWHQQSYTGKTYAGHYESEDGTIVAKQKMRFKIVGILPASFGEEKTFSFGYILTTRNLDSGVETKSYGVQAITFDAGQTNKWSEDWIYIDAPSGNATISVEADPDNQPTDESFSAYLGSPWTKRPEFSWRAHSTREPIKLGE